MTGKGQISTRPNRRLRAVLIVHAIWLLGIFVLAGWWGTLVFRQSARIAELEQLAGVASTVAQAQWRRTQHMLIWEGASYFLLFGVVSAVLIWLYWRDAMRTRGMEAFFASVTHELRTPLTSIRLQAESIADAFKPDAPERALIQRLLEDSTRLESQVERTLELARVEGGGPLLTRPLRLKPWFERTFESIRESYGARAKFTLTNDDAVIDADPSALQVILKNLVENSIRYATGSRLEVTIESRKTPSGVEVLYRDSGPGYAGDAGKLGGLFQRGKDSQGAGVGLYLVQVLASRMGGRVEFGGGAGFPVQFHFPEAKYDGGV